MAWASTCATTTSCSACSSGCTRRANFPAPASGSRWSSARSRATAGECGARAPSGRAQRSASPCRRGRRVPSVRLTRSVVPAALAFACGYGGDLGAAELIDLSLEQLANIEVTSVSGRAERLADAAASIYVITNEDIRRAGVTSLPEALRLAPNLHVARGSSSGHSISARGFNNSAGNKLLVLIDGRS